MEFQHLRVFVALAEVGNMTEVAKHLSVSQPAISSALAQFEAEIGFPLFHRTRGGLALTSRAVEILDKARAVLRESEEIQNAGHRVSSDTGELRIAGRPGFMQYVFPLLLPKIAEELPGISVKQVLSGSSSEVVGALRTGQVDLAFSASPNIKSLTPEIIFQDPVWIAVAKEHPLSRKRQLDLKQLSGLPFCLPIPTDRLRPPIDRLLKRIGRTSAATIESNDYTLMKRLIATGGFAGFVYAHMMLSADSEGIVPLRIRGLDLVRDLTILHRRDDLLPHVATARRVIVLEARRILEANRKKFNQ